jgi:hypothetical protein
MRDVSGAPRAVCGSRARDSSIAPAITGECGGNFMIAPFTDWSVCHAR